MLVDLPTSVNNPGIGVRSCPGICVWNCPGICSRHGPGICLRNLRSQHFLWNVCCGSFHGTYTYTVPASASLLLFSSHLRNEAHRDLLVRLAEVQEHRLSDALPQGAEVRHHERVLRDPVALVVECPLELGEVVPLVGHAQVHHSHDLLLLLKTFGGREEGGNGVKGARGGGQAGWEEEG